MTVKASGVVFGDGLREIRACQPELDVLTVYPRKHTQKSKNAKNTAMSAREIAVLVSCIAPLCIGWAFLTVMLKHEAIYITYWLTVWAWWGFVLYANKKRVRRHRGNGKRTKANHKYKATQSRRICK